MFNQKQMTLIILVAISLFGIGFFYFQLKNTIYGPFEKETKKIIPEEISKMIEEERLRDTDQDGLTDLKETVYQTSIYLADTDADGFSDKEEVDSGSNPLNPRSTPYQKIAPEPKEPLTTPKKEDIFKELSAPEIDPSDPEIFRQILIQAGMPKEDVDKLDDNTLKMLYNEIMKRGAEGTLEAPE